MVRRFKCTYCDLRCLQKGTLKDHIAVIHKVPRSEIAPYRAAGKFIAYFNYTSWQLGLMIFLFMIVPEIHPFKCSRCDRTFKTRKEVQQHLAKYCGVIPSFHCATCDHRFKTKGDLKKHCMNVH